MSVSSLPQNQEKNEKIGKKNESQENVKAFQKNNKLILQIKSLVIMLWELNNEVHQKNWCFNL